MNEYEYINDTIARETAFDEGYEAGKQAAAEQIFADLEEFHAVGNYSEFYVLTEESIKKLKKKYGVK
jgi:hypothetical protein